MSDSLSLADFVEVLYQVLSRNFIPSDFLEKINYPLARKCASNPDEANRVVLTSHVFSIWVVMFSVMKRFDDSYSEILDSFLKLLWGRSNLKESPGGYNSFVSTVCRDFDAYDKALLDENDPIFKLCCTFLGNLSREEVHDPRTVLYVGSYFGEMLQAYDQIFDKLDLLPD